MVAMSKRPLVCTSFSNEGHSVRVWHYERATLLFKRAVLLLILTALKISDLDMAADIFTKPVEKEGEVHPHA